MATYILAGCAGFIGSHVAQKLLDTGHQIIGIDNLNDAYDPGLKEWRLNQLIKYENFSFHYGDIRDMDFLSRVTDKMQSCDGIINLAARAGVRQSVSNPWIYIDTNVKGTLNLLELCTKRGIEKFVLASTSSLYGGRGEGASSESMNTNYPLSPYAASKSGAEAFCHSYHYLYGLDVTVFRYFTVFGPAGRPEMSIFRFIKWINEGEPVTIYGDGTQSRDFTYVDDIVNGTIAGLRPLGFEIINLGSDQPYVLNDIIHMIENKLHKEAQIEYLPRHKADIKSSWADIQKARRLLDWEPKTSMNEAIQITVDWYLQNQHWAKDIEITVQTREKFL